MLKKTLRRLGAMAMVMAMAVSVFAVNASAAGVGESSLTIKKTVTADGNTYAPATTFNFEIAAARAGEYDGNVVYAGVTGGAYFAQGAGQIAFSAADGIIDADAGMTGTTTISTDVSVFEKPGVYHYTVKETNDGYEGIAYDEAIRDLYVYVTYGENNNLVVSNVVLTKDTTKTIDKELVVEKTKTDEWVNDYGKNNDTIHSAKVIKAVTGNQGDKNKAFDFEVSVQGADNEKYKVVYKTAASDATEQEVAVDSGAEPITISIKDTGYIQIYGLSASDAYTIQEADYSSDGYTTTDNEVVGKTTSVNVEYTVTNDKNANVPTGVIMTIAPYALMVVLAGAFAVVFLTRRNRAE